jgi:hypothetical protein
MSAPTIARPEGVKMSRSPIFVTGKSGTQTGDSLDYMDINLKVWAGSKALPPSTNLYTMSKNYAVNGVINFELSDLIRSQFSHDFTIYQESGFTQSPLNEVLWVTANGQWTYTNNGTFPPITADHTTGTTHAFLATDGWASKTNAANEQVFSYVMADERVYYVTAMTSGVLPVRNVDIASVTIEWQNGDADTFYGLDGLPWYASEEADSTRDEVIYLGVYPANLDGNTMLDGAILPQNHGEDEWYDVVLRDVSGGELQRVRFQLVCEPKYQPIQVAWVNRYGVMDMMTFFKVSTEQGNFTNESYQRSVYADGFTTPSVDKGEYVDFNINSRNTITLNSGFVEEEYKNIIQDILMSEYSAILVTQQLASTIWNEISILWQKWASYWNNGNIADSYWIAANPNRGSVDYFKEVNQRLINYTLSFTFAFNERMTLR